MHSCPSGRRKRGSDGEAPCQSVTGVSASQDGSIGGAFHGGLGAAGSDVYSCCPETTVEISWNSRSRASPCSGEGGYCVSVHKVPRMGGRGERHTKSVVKRNESRQLATAECRLCRAASFIGAQTGGRFMLSNKPNWKWSTSRSPASRLLPPALGRVCSRPEIHCFPSAFSTPSFLLSSPPSLPPFTSQLLPQPMAGFVPWC